MSWWTGLEYSIGCYFIILSQFRCIFSTFIALFIICWWFLPILHLGCTGRRHLCRLLVAGERHIRFLLMILILFLLFWHWFLFLVLTLLVMRGLFVWSSLRGLAARIASLGFVVDENILLVYQFVGCTLSLGCWLAEVYIAEAVGWLDDTAGWLFQGIPRIWVALLHLKSGNSPRIAHWLYKGLACVLSPWSF